MSTLKGKVKWFDGNFTEVAQFTRIHKETVKLNNSRKVKKERFSRREQIDENEELQNNLIKSAEKRHQVAMEEHVRGRTKAEEEVERMRLKHRQEMKETSDRYRDLIGTHTSAIEKMKKENKKMRRRKQWRRQRRRSCC